MQLLVYFLIEERGNTLIFKLKEEEKENFIKRLSGLSRNCYVSPSKLREYMRDNKLLGKQCLEEFILPTEPIIQSGDFGEMLSYLLLKEYLLQEGVLVYGPKKWYWKNDRNKAAPKADVIFFNMPSKTPSLEDKVITVESKMKSTKTTKNPIKDAIDGAKDDKLNRLAKTLIWLDEIFAKNKRPNLRKVLKRFRSPSEYPSYQKKYNAVAVIDEELIENELLKPIDNLDDEIQVWAISIKLLKETYQKNIQLITDIPW